VEREHLPLAAEGMDLAKQLPDSKQSGCAKFLTNSTRRLLKAGISAGQDLCKRWNSAEAVVSPHERCYQRSTMLDLELTSMCFSRKPGALAGFTAAGAATTGGLWRRVSIESGSR